ncbi:hypothetical protein CYMTET_23171 [Cymbomonas tetramitiformis]|uniref:Nucleotide-diphospho-sugar transferase domain-containing protein n=1 Tax=Cymbomonas tetramitiformis TaxID=36881 RepID=A0AAE0FZ80_9CHLO|nr:hypothetical protein CYMTET_23171 [Cymbomonas tetramitiformis]
MARRRDPESGRDAIVLALVCGIFVGAFTAYMGVSSNVSSDVPHQCPPVECNCGTKAESSLQANNLISKTEGNSALRAVLERVAINKEVLVAVSNGALITEEGTYGILATWIESVKRAGVKNFMIVALDDRVAKACENVGVAYWRQDRASLADNNQDNHGISAQKFGYLKEFLKLGYNVLLSDVDVVTLQVLCHSARVPDVPCG